MKDEGARMNWSLHPSSLCLQPLLTMRRTERVADLLREEILQIVGYELEDPRLIPVTVTDVRLSDNLKALRVYITVAGNEEEHKAALAALRHATPYVRRQLGLSLNLSNVPEVIFVRDRVEEEGERVDQLLARIEQEWEERKDEG
jgi:ribosome-binding factor A